MKEDHFIKFLKKHKDESYFLVSAPGNSGDTLLKKGLELYLKKNKYKTMNNIDDAENILIHGGGNIDDVWHCGKELFKKITTKYPNKKIVVAPNTCHFFKTNFEEILNNCKQEIHFFTRERNSFKRLKNMNLNKNIHLYLANDTAFLLENTSYLNRIKKQREKNYILLSMRTDKESAFLKYEFDPHKKDFKEKIKYWYIIRLIKNFMKRELINKHNNRKKITTDASHRPYETFVSLISNASEIYTDRLHVGILGAMLGIKVYLYPGKYDKIQGVYEQTLHLYPNVVKMF